MNDAAIETLQKRRLELLSHKERVLERINSEISSIDSAIEKLSGKTVWETEPQTLYDDENPDYIKASIEEI